MTKKKKNIPLPKKPQEQTKTPVQGTSPQPKVQSFSAPPSQKQKAADTKSVAFVFGKINYLIMIGGVLIMALGYILMIGGGSKDPNVFNPEIFNTQRLTVAPLLILLGIAVEFVAILYKPKS